jgi:excisionase family DNA binding protein
VAPNLSSLLSRLGGNTMQSTSDFYSMTTRQAAILLRVAPTTVRRMIRRGELWGQREGGGSYYVSRADVEALRVRSPGR